MFTKIVNWLVLSSKNPGQVSLTAKAGLVFLLPLISFSLNLANIEVGQDTLSAIIDHIVLFIQNALATVSGLVMIYGLIRKLWVTYKEGHANM